VPVLARVALAAGIVLVLLTGGCGDGEQHARTTQTFNGPTRAITTAAPSVWSSQPPLVTDKHGCGFGSRWDAKGRTCRLMEAGRAREQTGHGALRLVREPLVELFPPTSNYNVPAFWVYMRLNRKPTHLIDTSINRSRHDLDTPLGIDLESKDGRCVAIAFDIPPGFFDRSLRNPRPGQRVTVTVTIRSGDRVRRTAPTRIRLALPNDDFDAPARPWFKALGCSGD
jgi:hypothetical protein